MKQRTANFTIYHWDTFDDTTFAVGEADTLEAAQKFVQDRYKGRIRPNGADRVDIVDLPGNVIETYNVG
jgi:hypothetical protein